MATSRRLAALLCAFAALACHLRTASAVDANELTFPKIAAANATKQWKLALARGNLASPDFTPVNCSSPALGACTATNPPLMQDTGDLLRVTYTLATPRGADGGLLTFNGGVPTKVQLRACYTLASSVDRAWRKKNKPYPRLSQNCPRTFFSAPFVGAASPVDAAANTGVAYWDFNNVDEIPTATWFIMMWVYCGDTVCAFESTEGAAAVPATPTTPEKPAVPGNFVETAVEMGITPGMKAAAIILSIFGPAFFVCFYAADSWHYKKKGTPLRF